MRDDVNRSPLLVNEAINPKKNRIIFNKAQLVFTKYVKINLEQTLVFRINAKSIWNTIFRNL